jgi:hypothetical protein
MSNVFDNGGFADRAKRDKQSSPLKRYWNHGFNAGYQSALDRYIPADRDKIERD